MAGHAIVVTDDMEWENGLDVVASMTAEFRENLGPAEDVQRMYVRYNQKVLRPSDGTTRRMDLIRLDAGYRDLTNAYHDSVEECLVLEGELDLDGEGHFQAGDYFWRPPGWVHAAGTQGGFTALLVLQGDAPLDGSGPTSRRIRPAEEAGTNALHPDDAERAIGPRGWVRRLETSLVAWQPGGAFVRGEGACVGLDPDRMAVKVLSANPLSGAKSVLVRLDPGYAQSGAGRHTAGIEFYVTDGSCALGGQELRAGTYVRFEPGAVQPPLESAGGARLFAKIDGWLDRHRA